MSLSALRTAVTSTNEAARRAMPVLPALEGIAEILPDGGLRRGSTVAVDGSISLVLALLATPADEGPWTAIVGVPELGVLAGEAMGVDLERLALVPDPGSSWPNVVAALVDAFDVVAVRSPGRDRVSPGLASQLGARLRKHGSVLVSIGPWPGADLSITTSDVQWEGMGDGYGRLKARRLAVRIAGRGTAAHPREESLWLPSADGRVVVDRPVTPLRIMREAV